MSSFFDKVKQAAEQAGARAREEMQLMAARRDLNAAYGELGRTAFELAEKGELANPGLNAAAERIRTLKTELEALESRAATAPSGEEEVPAQPAEPPSAPQ